MIFATFQAFEFFQLLKIPWLFDNLDESTTVLSALPPLPKISSVPSSLRAKSDDPVIFKISCRYPSEALEETFIKVG